MKKQVFPLLLITLLLILGCKNTNTEIIEDTVEIEETFSLPNGAIPITYYRNQNYDKPFEFSKLGFSYKNRNKTLFTWIVTGFFKDSPAEKSGLQVNDEIVFINGVSILDISYKDEENFLKNLDKIELVVLRNGEEMTFEFESFENQRRCVQRL